MDLPASDEIARKALSDCRAESEDSKETWIRTLKLGIIGNAFDKPGKYSGPALNIIGFRSLALAPQHLQFLLTPGMYIGIDQLARGRYGRLLLAMCYKVDCGTMSRWLSQIGFERHDIEPNDFVFIKSGSNLHVIEHKASGQQTQVSTQDLEATLQKMAQQDSSILVIRHRNRSWYQWWV